MSDDADVCGHPTDGGDGPPCQNPPGENGRCHIPGHNPDSDKENPGRPSTFTDADARTALKAARKGKSESGIEREVGVGDRTIFGENGWVEQDLEYTDEDGQRRDFSRDLKRARAQGEDQWLREGQGEDGDSSFAKFMLAASYDYTKTEKREVTGEGGGPVEVNLNETVVETGYSDE